MSYKKLINFYASSFSIMLLWILFSPLYSRADTSSNLVAHWALDGNANGLSGGNNGALNDSTGTAWLTPGKIGAGSLAFNRSRYVYIPGKTTYKFGSSDFSVALWIKTNTFRYPSEIYFSKGLGSSTGLRISVLGGGISTKVGATTLQANSDVISSTQDSNGNFIGINDDKWHFVVLTRSSGTANLYIDSRLYVTVANVLDNVDVDNENIYFGTGTNLDTDRANGWEDDVYLYQGRALSQQDIIDLYNVGGGDEAPPSVSWTLPANASTISGPSVTFTASAADNVKLAKIQFKIDDTADDIHDTLVGGEITTTLVSGNFSTSWDSSLKTNGTYNFYVVATDTNGNTGKATRSLTISNDLVAPTILSSSPSGALAADTRGAAMTVTTNKSSTCRYSTTNQAYASMTNSFTASSNGLTHSAVATGLSNGGSYLYFVRCQTTSANTMLTSHQIRFTVNLDNNKPAIDIINVYDITKTSATVSWATDEPSTTLISGSGLPSVSQGALVTSHVHTFSNLTAGTTYTFNVTSVDSSGNQSIASSSSFTTVAAINPSSTSVSDIYIAQTALGNGRSNCSQAQSIDWLNSADGVGHSYHWINPYIGDSLIGPGTTIHICGTISTPLISQGSGLPGYPITIKFETGAKFSAPIWPTYSINAGSNYNAAIAIINGHSHLVIDGGTNPDGTPNGIIESTDNGTLKNNQRSAVYGIVIGGVDSSHDIEVKNLKIQNLYVRVRQNLHPGGITVSPNNVPACATNFNDPKCGGNQDNAGGVGISFSGRNISIHDNVIDQVPNGIQGSFSVAPAHMSNVDVYKNKLSNLSWGITLASNGTTGYKDDQGRDIPPQRADNISVHDNTISDESAWGGLFWSAGDEGLQLLCGRTYYFRAYTIDDSNVAHYGPEQSFNMISCSNPNPNDMNRDIDTASANVHIKIGDGGKQANGIVVTLKGQASAPSVKSRGYQIGETPGVYQYSTSSTVETNWDWNHNNGIYFWARSNSTITNSKVFNNLIGGNWSDSNTADIFILDNIDNIFIFNNVLFESGGANAYITAASGGKRQVIANNTIIGDGAGSGSAVGDVGQTTVGLRTNAILTVNNIFYRVGLPVGLQCFTCSPSQQTGPSILQHLQLQGAIEDIDRNSYFNPGGPLEYGFIGMNKEQWQTLSNYDQNSLTIDPKLTTLSGEASERYRLQADSPARGAAENLTRYCVGVPELCIGKNGVSRPATGPWDIGAYQVSSNAIVDVTPPTVPANFLAYGISASLVALSWSPSTDSGGVSYYEVYRCLGVGCTPVYYAQTSQTTYADSMVALDNSYTYTVLAVDSSLNKSAHSTRRLVKVNNNPVKLPMAPTNIRARSVSN